MCLTQGKKFIAITTHKIPQTAIITLTQAFASLYDIKEFFQGRNAQGKLNLPAKAKDEHYKQLYANLQDALKDLAKEIQPKVYEYGFLRE
ncbi:hypothetical protein HpCK63_14780 [Helicobacter pylori]